MLNTRTLAVVVGALSLALGLWAVMGDTAALGVAAGAMGLVAGLLALLDPVPGSSAGGSRNQLDATDPGVGFPDAADGASSGKDQDSAVADRGVSGDAVHAHPGPDHAGTGSVESDRITAHPAPAASLTDPVTELFSEAYLRVALESRLASARRHLRPVSVVVIQVTEGLPDNNVGAAPAGRVADAIRETVREADIACRLDDGTFAIILEDTPETGAVWTVERVRRNLVSRFGHHTLWAGVACYPAHAFDAPELLTQVHAALGSAKEWNQDRIEVAISD